MIEDTPVVNVEVPPKIFRRFGWREIRGQRCLCHFQVALDLDPDFRWTTFRGAD